MLNDDLINIMNEESKHWYYIEWKLIKVNIFFLSSGQVKYFRIVEDFNLKSTEKNETRKKSRFNCVVLIEGKSFW